MSDVVTDRVFKALVQLRLTTAASTLETHIHAAGQRDFSPLQFVDHLLADEVAARQERSITVRTKLAHLPMLKSLDSFDFDAQPALDRKVVKSLETLAFVDRVDFVAVDPNVNRMTIQILAVVAENEVKAISERTKAALAAKKARGGLLGAARPGAPQITREAGRMGSAIGAQSMRQLAGDAYTDLVPALRSMRANGLSLRAIAARLDAEGHTTRRGRSWTPAQVARVVARL